ncbi:hypothetical protein BCR43DRAFT_517541 [Syncephalastrum racemosum]|uniref:Calycin-like protein n=1 Tax=Syncephalastrum racemosum TaxID=13706 RepID=A0A1X2H4J8_SYNRA|nr:hypothetical protein BCR43DRAFT_517541 [Syncephalastrum racemosum]
MNTFLPIIFFLALLTTTCCGASLRGGDMGCCPPNTAVNVTDLSFFNGKWYTAAVSPALQRIIQNVCPCPTAEFEDRKNNTLSAKLSCDNSTLLTHGWMDVVNHTATDFTFTPRCLGPAPLSCHPALVNAHIIDLPSMQAVYFWDPCNLNQTSLIFRNVSVNPDIFANVTRALNTTRPLVQLNTTCHLG